MYNIADVQFVLPYMVDATTVSNLFSTAACMWTPTVPTVRVQRNSGDSSAGVASNACLIFLSKEVQRAIKGYPLGMMPEAVHRAELALAHRGSNPGATP